MGSTESRHRDALYRGVGATELGVGSLRVEPTGDVGVEPTGDERLAEESGPLYSFGPDALANLVAAVIAHTRATDADVIAHTPATGAEVGVRDAQLNRLLDGCGIGNIDEFNVQVGKRLEGWEAADEVGGRRSAGWEPPWTSLYGGIAWFIVGCGALLFLFWQLVLAWV